MNPLIIIPTYNESHKLPLLLDKILDLKRNYAILVIDDNSPDGTGDIADEYASKYDTISVMHRKEKKEIGSALKDGFKYVIDTEFDPVITMDGDLSHDPCYLEDLLKYASGYGLVLASRYINGVRVDGWRFRKLLTSKFANMFAAYLMVKPVWDFTSGYRCYSREFLKSINIDDLTSEGYLIQIQLIYLAYHNKFGLKEIPFIYKDTEYGYSKIRREAISKTFKKMFKYRAPFLEILRHLAYMKKDYTRFVEEYEELLNPPQLKNNGKFEIPARLSVSIGVMAYNEQENIAKCLNALLNQQIKTCDIREIFVVSSGSTDHTDRIVMEYCDKNNIVHLIQQAERRGKASAINEFLKRAGGDICIIESADTVTQPDTIEKLVNPFYKPEVGMTGAHPVPVNKEKGIGFIAYAVKKMWRLHHLMAMDNPKCGELIAFRNIVPSIPNYTAVDEATIEAIFNSINLKKEYVPDAIVFNKGPETLSDLIKQRRRIAAGHRHLSASMGYAVSTLKSSGIFKYIIKDFSWHPRNIIFLIMLCFVEAFSRMIGNLDFYLRDKNPYIWDISKTTKNMTG